MTSPLAIELDHRVLAEGLDHPEGVCWDPVRRCLWAGGEAGQVYRIELDGQVTVLVTIAGGSLLGVALDARGRLYVCDPGNHQVWQVNERGTYEAYGDQIDYPNYAAFAPNGRLYVSDSGSIEEATGQLLVIDADGTTTRVATRPIGYANGLCADANTLWVVESSVPGVSALDLRGGSLELTIEMERCTPDGLALDASGALLISCYQPNQLWRWSHDEGLQLIFDDWTGEYALSPTNVAFYGTALDRLALASLCGTRITSVSLPHPGAGVTYPEFEERSA